MFLSHFERYSSGLIDRDDRVHGPYDMRFIDQMADRGFPVDRMLRKLIPGGRGTVIHVEDCVEGRTFVLKPQPSTRARSFIR